MVEVVTYQIIHHKNNFLILELLEKIKKKSGKKSQISSQNKTTPTAITNPTI